MICRASQAQKSRGRYILKQKFMHVCSTFSYL
uniref:Uncharacterized protein n=1 Tax=Arundo donax TaxID=35708 RepID=A0A0A8YH29_ARUDO